MIANIVLPDPTSRSRLPRKYRGRVDAMYSPTVLGNSWLASGVLLALDNGLEEVYEKDLVMGYGLVLMNTETTVWGLRLGAWSQDQIYAFAIQEAALKLTRHFKKGGFYSRPKRTIREYDNLLRVIVEKHPLPIDV